MTGNIEFKHHRRAWTEQERETLKTLYPFMGTARVAHTMLRSYVAISSEASRLQLRKHPSFYERKSTPVNESKTSRRRPAKVSS